MLFVLIGSLVLNGILVLVVEKDTKLVKELEAKVEALLNK